MLVVVVHVDHTGEAKDEADKMNHYEVPDGYRFKVREDSWIGLTVRLQRRHVLWFVPWWITVQKEDTFLRRGDTLEKKVLDAEDEAWRNYQRRLAYREEVNAIVTEK